LADGSALDDIMADNHALISIRGKRVEVPSVCVGDAEIITTGVWLRTAAIRDDDYYEGDPSMAPVTLIRGFRRAGGKADIFTFFQRVPDVSPRHRYPVYWDNVAAIPLTTYAAWWGSLPQETRRNVRLAAKRGVLVSAVPFTDELCRGIMGLYNETPVRQGRRFWHYGKDFDTVKRENSTFEGRSEFIAAYYGAELIGFIKMVRTGNLAGIMQILSKASHQDKRPTNALIAKAVEICVAKGMSHLLYCKYVYHKNYKDALTEFKRRNSFQQVSFPRYFVPLTLKGRLAIALKLQLGPGEFLPQSLVVVLLNARARWHARKLGQNDHKTPQAASMTLDQHSAG
jgi:hypothetical protein